MFMQLIILYLFLILFPASLRSELLNSRSVWYDSLSSSHIASKYSKQPDDFLVGLEEIELPVIIDVYLVGFNNDGFRDLSVPTQDLSKYLEASQENSAKINYLYSLNALHNGEDDEATNSTAKTAQKLPFRTKYHYRVHHSGPQLIKAVEEALANKVNNIFDSTERDQPAIDGEFSYSIPVSTVDSLIRNDYLAHSQLSQANTIYIINPKVPLNPLHSSRDSEKAQLGPVHYAYTVGLDDTITDFGTVAQCNVYGWIGPGNKPENSGNGAENVSPGQNKAGEQRRHRYLWLDLSAGPISFGPNNYGDGVITEFSYPRPISMFPADSARDRIAHNFRIQQFSASLSATLRSIASLLFSPGFYDFPLPYTPKIRINLVFLHEKHTNKLAAEEISKASSGDREAQEWAEYLDDKFDEKHWEKFENQQERSPWAGWNSVELAINSLILPGQQLEFERFHIKFEECDLCVAALLHSTQTQTTTAPAGNSGRFAANHEGISETQGNLHFSQHNFLNSAEMRDWLEHFDSNVWRIRQDAQEELEKSVDNRRDVAENEEFREENKKQSGNRADFSAKLGLGSSNKLCRVLNVFIYDLNSAEELLFDNFHQAVAFSDLVLAVQTTAAPQKSGYHCNSAGLHSNPRDSSRAVLGSLLTALYGVLPSHLSYNPSAQKMEENYLLSFGYTPFGPFSRSTALSAALQDQANRNVILSEIGSVVMGLNALLLHFYSHSNDLNSALAASYREFTQRYNYLQHLIHTTLQNLINHNYHDALLYARAAKHDSNQLIRLLNTAFDKLTASLSCGAHPENPPAAAPVAQILGGGKIKAFILPIIEISFLLFMLVWTAFWTGPGLDWYNNSHFARSNHPLARLLRFFSTLGGLRKDKRF
jgi:hypothetical protein